MTDNADDRTPKVLRRTAVENRVTDIVAMLAGVVNRLRIPLMVIAVLPLVPALVLAVIGALSSSWLVAAMALIGVVPAGWLLIRRHQLVTALQPPEIAVAELRASFSPAEIGEQLKANLEQVRGQKLELKPRKLAGTLWKGIRLGTGLYSQLTDVPRLQPFLPGRLRGLAFLSAACVLCATILALVAGLALVFTSIVLFYN